MFVFLGIPEAFGPEIYQKPRFFGSIWFGLGIMIKMSKMSYTVQHHWWALEALGWWDRRKASCSCPQEGLPEQLRRNKMKKKSAHIIHWHSICRFDIPFYSKTCNFWLSNYTTFNRLTISRSWSQSRLCQQCRVVEAPDKSIELSLDGSWRVIMAI